MNQSLPALAGLLVLAGPADARPLHEAERVLLSEALSVWQAVGDDVWSGWTATRMPIVFVVEDVEFGIGFDAPLTGAERTEPLGHADVSVRPRTFGPGLAASFFVEGRPAVIIGTPEVLGWSPTEWAAKAIHEMFHVLQYSRGSPAKVASLAIGPENDPSWQLDYPFPYESDAVMRSAHAVGYCLHQAMAADTDADRNYAAGTAEDARAVLRALLAHETGDDTAFRYARFQSHTEGVAYWTEREVVRHAARGYEPSPAFLSLPDAVTFQELWQDSYRNAPFLVKHIGRAARSRLMFYHLGFGLASVLEELDPAWKRTYFDPDVWVDGMLAGGVAAACESPSE